MPSGARWPSNVWDWSPSAELAGGAKEQALASRLIQAVKEECQTQPARVAAALSVFRYAKWLVSREGGDPQVVLAAALLLEISHPASGTENAPPGQGPAKVREILQRLSVDEAAVAQVCRIVACCRTATDIDVRELRIVRDASVLARLFSERPGGCGRRFAADHHQVVHPCGEGGGTACFLHNRTSSGQLSLAFEALGRQSDDQLRWLGAEPAGSAWRLPALNDTFAVDPRSRRVTASGSGKVSPQWRILALHYLAVAARPERLAPEVTFADLPTARSYAEVYRQRTTARLCATIGRDSGRLQAAAAALGARNVAGGDARL